MDRRAWLTPAILATALRGEETIRNADMVSNELHHRRRRMIERTTTVVAAGAATSPWWLPYLRDWSEISGLLLPIVGTIWIIAQLLHFLWRLIRKPDR